MFYFVYCTWLDEEELRKYSPKAIFVTKAKARNIRVEFRAGADRRDRGWCHLNDTGTARGEETYGLIYMLPEEDSIVDYDDFDRCFLTVRGDDGNVYDCFTYRLTHPGVAMRPPDYYWQHIPTGLKKWNFPQEYIDKIWKVFNDALPCPDADRPQPTVAPGKSAESR